MNSPYPLPLNRTVLIVGIVIDHWLSSTQFTNYLGLLHKTLLLVRIVTLCLKKQQKQQS
jgi:hypothetical protein